MPQPMQARPYVLDLFTLHILNYIQFMYTYHAVQSFNKPADIVIAPTLVRSNLSSAKIRANTGKAYYTCTYIKSL
jgi:hypothetical protein